MEGNAKTQPVPVIRALRKLGRDIRDARRRRRIPTAIMAERAGIGRMTLFRIENGDPAVSCGGYAAVLFSLGMIGRLEDIADPRFDSVGMEIEEERVSIGHEASVSKVGEDQLFYLQSRGISEVEATKMIVNGFVEPIVKELPMEYAVELNRLIELQMEGAVG